MRMAHIGIRFDCGIGQGWFRVRNMFFVSGGGVCLCLSLAFNSESCVGVGFECGLCVCDVCAVCVCMSALSVKRVCGV